jgi:hypothetical protein
METCDSKAVLKELVRAIDRALRIQNMAEERFESRDSSGRPIAPESEDWNPIGPMTAIGGIVWFYERTPIVGCMGSGIWTEWDAIEPSRWQKQGVSPRKDTRALLCEKRRFIYVIVSPEDLHGIKSSA